MARQNNNCKVFFLFTTFTNLELSKTVLFSYGIHEPARRRVYRRRQRTIITCSNRRSFDDYIHPEARVVELKLFTGQMVLLGALIKRFRSHFRRSRDREILVGSRHPFPVVRDPPISTAVGERFSFTGQSNVYRSIKSSSLTTRYFLDNGRSQSREETRRARGTKLSAEKHLEI